MSVSLLSLPKGSGKPPPWIQMLGFFNYELNTNLEETWSQQINILKCLGETPELYFDHVKFINCPSSLRQMII